MKSAFLHPDDFRRLELAEGAAARIASGERIMLSEVTIEPDGLIPLHSHPHEQAGRCISGEFELEVDGESRRIRAGDYYLIPGHAPHLARGVGQRAVTLDIFSPPREEYLSSGDASSNS